MINAKKLNNVLQKLDNPMTVWAIGAAMSFFGHPNMLKYLSKVDPKKGLPPFRLPPPGPK